MKAQDINLKRLPNISFTKEGLENIKSEYQTILESRKEAVKNLSRARELGDLSENGFYKAARARLSSIDYNLRRLKTLIKRAEVIDNQQIEIVGIGSKINVSDGKNTRDFYIVGRYESYPLSGKISDASPIGRGLMGKTVGDSIKIKTPSGEITYKILKIKD